MSYVNPMLRAKFESLKERNPATLFSIPYLEYLYACKIVTKRLQFYCLRETNTYQEVNQDVFL